MARICFVTYEIHPTTWGGAGVLLHHAASRLLEAGHEVVFLLDVPKKYFDRFRDKDRETFPRFKSCRAYHVDELCKDLELQSEIQDPFIRQSARFDHALARILEIETFDFVEFFEYCGVGYHSLVSKIFGVRHGDTVLGMRAHNSIELIDCHESTKPLDISRLLLYALERGGLGRSETVLFPSRLYADVYYKDRYELEENAIVVSEPPTEPFGRREELDPDSHRDEVVYFGRVFSFKGVELFLQAGLAYLAKHPSTGLNFVMIGSDSHDSPEGTSYIGYLKTLIPDCFLDRFEFTGHLDHAETLARLSHSRFAVFPNRFESFCYSMHEVYDAGVPLIANKIPAFENVLEDEQTALFFDGSLEGLVLAMERLDTDPELLERLSLSHPIIENPLGEFYASPYAGVPIPSEPDRSLAIQVVIMVPLGASAEDTQATLRSVSRGLGDMDEALVFRELDPGASASDPGQARFTWLGKACGAESLDRKSAGMETLRTLDALCVLRSGDVMDAVYLDRCRAALGKSAMKLGFAGTWSRDQNGVLRGTDLDLAPELYPFENGGRLTRSVLRTDAGKSVVELFDPALGTYGEIGHLWKTIVEVGNGCLLPTPLLTTRDEPAAELRPELLAYLVANADDATFRRRLASVAVARSGGAAELKSRSGDVDRAAPSAPSAFRREARALEVAERELNGRALLRLAVAKFRRKLFGFIGSSRPDGRT